MSTLLLKIELIQEYIYYYHMLNMDWTVGLFLDYVCDNFLDLFFWIILLEGNRSLVLREGEMQSISTQGGVENY